MMSTSTNTGYSLFQALPDELIYEINLMALDVYNEHRKRLMRSVRRKGIERIMTDSGMWGGPVVQFQRAQKLVNTDGMINKLVDQVVNEDWDGIVVLGRCLRSRWVHHEVATLLPRSVYV